MVFVNETYFKSMAMLLNVLFILLYNFMTCVFVCGCTCGRDMCACVEMMYYSVVIASLSCEECCEMLVVLFDLLQ